MTTVQQLLDDVLNEGAFDASPAQALRWLDRRHKSMCSMAKAYVIEEAVTLPTGPLTTPYALVAAPLRLVEAYMVMVDGTVFRKARRSDIADVVAATFNTARYGPVFIEAAPTEPAALGERYLQLVPGVVATPGVVASVTGAFTPPDLVADASGVLRVDDEAVEGLLAGVFATALSRPSEARTDLASYYEGQFTAAAAALAERVRRRMKGTGPRHIRLEV